MKVKVKWTDSNSKSVIERFRWLFFIFFLFSVELSDYHPLFSLLGLGSLSVFIYGLVLHRKNPSIVKQKKKKIRDKWYSGWALFWWILLFWPGAIIYMIIKASNRDHNSK